MHGIMLRVLGQGGQHAQKNTGYVHGAMTERFSSSCSWYESVTGRPHFAQNKTYNLMYTPVFFST